ncbi:hypothetical protein GFGA_1d1429 [Gluconobacter frateurii NBRC 103465]|nr:hypothetical protein GFGA_1d1429 [Gluconobacter frateurii NBRC 103465]
MANLLSVRPTSVSRPSLGLGRLSTSPDLSSGPIQFTMLPDEIIVASQTVVAGFADTSSITVLTITKAALVVALAIGFVISSNFGNDQTGTLQFYLNYSGLNTVYSTASRGLNNQSFRCSLTSVQMLSR